MMQDNNEQIERDSELFYQKAKEKTIYPTGIKDISAWDNYVIFSNQWKKHIQRYYKSELIKTEIDLAQNPARITIILKQYPKLTKTEKDKIEKINQEIWYLVQKSTLYKKRAFGDDTVNLTEKGFIADEVSGCEPLIIDLSGRFYKAEEIHRVLIEDMDISSISLSQIKTVIKNNYNKIKELQENFKNDYSDIRLGYKKSRLEELSEIYRERKATWNRNHYKEDEQQLTKLLELIKKEVEGDIVLNGKLDITVENKADEYIQKEMLKSMNIQMFVLARIAGRMNVNPIMILSRLASSRYAQFSGLGSPLSPSRMEDEISYASDLTYDWTSITQKNSVFVEEEKRLSALPKLENKESLVSLKEKLKAQLKKSKEPLQEAKSEIDKNKK